MKAKNMTRPFIKFLRDVYEDRPVIGAEVGVLHGVNAEYILRTLNIERLYLVDNDVKRAKFLKEEHGEKVILLNGWSPGIASKVTEPLDFVYIDAIHEYEPVLEDCRGWYPKLKRDGFLGGHDYFDRFPGLMRGVQEFASEVGKTIMSGVWDWWLVTEEQSIRYSSQ